MHNKLFNYLTKNNISYSKQFGFPAFHSTNHAIVELVDEITNGFIENKHTLGVFIDLSIAFDTVNCAILLEKLHMYEVEGKKYYCSKLPVSQKKMCSAQ